MNDFSHKDFVLRINIDKKSKLRTKKQIDDDNLS